MNFQAPSVRVRAVSFEAVCKNGCFSVKIRVSCDGYTVSAVSGDTARHETRSAPGRGKSIRKRTCPSGKQRRTTHVARTKCYCSPDATEVRFGLFVFFVVARDPFPLRRASRVAFYCPAPGGFRTDLVVISRPTHHCPRTLNACRTGRRPPYCPCLPSRDGRRNFSISRPTRRKRFGFYGK